ncbi:hypothetical protein N9K54_07485, partial [Candidatus Poseidonia alphae]|nr:hypothetical protein [Candidatus Poseidonia alphae]
MVAAAEAVSRSEGFGGNVQMRRYPLQCDRGVIVAGRAGGIPSFFDSAVGGTGAHPLSGMGSGFTKVKPNEPVLVDPNLCCGFAFTGMESTFGRHGRGERNRR